MKKLLNGIKKWIGAKSFRYVFSALLIAAGIFLVAFSSWNLYAGQREYAEARAEYDSLRELYPVMAMISIDEPPSVNPDPEIQISEPAVFEQPAPEEETQQDPLAGLAELNPDFAGWISVEGLIDYPVVRGRDNSYYLSVTFTGKYNFAGTIMMDYRNARGFDEPVCVIYGHSMKDGSMFGNLYRYYSRAFMEANPNITIVTPEGEVLVYRIYAAKRTDAWDEVYDLDFPDAAAAAGVLPRAPAGASRFLVLSTCTSREDGYGRLLVCAYLADRDEG